METWKHFQILPDLALQIGHLLLTLEQLPIAKVRDRLFVRRRVRPIGHLIQHRFVRRVFLHQIGEEEQQRLLPQHIENRLHVLLRDRLPRRLPTLDPNPITPYCIVSRY